MPPDRRRGWAIIIIAGVALLLFTRMGRLQGLALGIGLVAIGVAVLVSRRRTQSS